MSDFSLIKGYNFVPTLLSPSQVSDIYNEVLPFVSVSNTAGIRNAERKFTTVNNLLSCSQFLQKVGQYLGDGFSFIRAIIFCKTPKANWSVPWHQDKTVVVSEKFDHKDWHNWTTKDDELHVQPPLSVLKKMVTCRIHLNDILPCSGGLSVISKSHQAGILNEAAILTLTQSKRDTIDFFGKAGSALFMRPLILHCSKKMTAKQNRLILHLEFSNAPLPNAIKWGSQV